MLVELLSFTGNLANKCRSFNNEPCMIRRTLIDLSPIRLNYFPFMISLDKCNGSCKAVNDWSTKICAPSETKDANVKSCDRITRISEFKTLVNHISCNSKCEFDSTTCNSNQEWNNNKFQCECIKYPAF